MALARVLTGPRQGYRQQKTCFRILVGIYSHNIPTHTPKSGYHGVANIAKVAENCINRIALFPLGPIQTPWSRDPETLFRRKIEKNKTFLIFDPKKWGSFLTLPPTPPFPTSLKTSKKPGFKSGWSRGVKLIG